jgi:hypothetical protein
MTPPAEESSSAMIYCPTHHCAFPAQEGCFECIFTRAQRLADAEEAADQVIQELLDAALNPEN